jgi:endonuclease YncB( thermonuclease family)
MEITMTPEDAALLDLMEQQQNEQDTLDRRCIEAAMQADERIARGEKWVSFEDGRELHEQRLSAQCER